MRFSSLFQQPAPQLSAEQEPVRVHAAPGEGSPPAAPALDLPDDLDARVRLLGEWQLLEG
jgi:hypothetical protein